MKNLTDGGGTSFAAKICEKCNMLRNIITYFTSMRVIFYTEIAIIMLCFLDLMFNCTNLIILILIGSNYAYSHSVMAIGMWPKRNPFYWKRTIIVLHTVYLIESLIRIYYCLKLAYQHNLKVKAGELCCMKCHKPLLSAAMSSEYIMPRFISALCLAIYYIDANVWTAQNTVEFHRIYFASSPFVNRNFSHDIASTMYYKMGTRVLETLRICLNSSLGIEQSAILLLETGNLMSVVSYKCALKNMHCIHGGYFLQLSADSVLSLINYTVMCALFNHVINMQQFEVHSLQSSLMSKDGSRIIRVYKLHQRRAMHGIGFSTGVTLVPRQALMSLLQFGSHLASRIRASSKAEGSQGISKDVLPAEPIEESIAEVVPFTMPSDTVDNQYFGPLDTDTNEGSWPHDKPVKTDIIAKLAREMSQRWNAAMQNSDAADIAIEDQIISQPLQEESGTKPIESTPHINLFNRRDAAANRKKVNFEHVKVYDLYPATNEQAVEMPSPQLNLAPEQQPEEGTSSTVDKAADASDTSSDPSLSLSTRRRFRGGSKRLNDTIFTDETFYSL